MFDWSLPSFPSGSWYFNPFCWQLLFVLGSWFALNGARLTAAAQRMAWLRIAAAVYLVFALVVALASHAPAAAAALADFGLDPFTRTDKENLAPYRVAHLLALGLIFTYLVPRCLPALRSRLLQPVMKCGEEWLASFCVGVFLSFAAHFILITGPASIAMQVLVSATGIAMMTAIACYLSWSRQQDSASGRRAEV
jgi:hypothetical protein